MLEFPKYLIPLLDDYQVTMDDNRKFTEMEDGFKKSKLNSCGTYEVITLAYHACKSHLLEFREWFKKDTKLGQKKFCWQDPCTGENYLAKIRDMPSWSPEDQCLEYWTISLTLEVRCVT